MLVNHTGIKPGIEYGSIVWSGLSSSDAARLERFNRSAARLITKTSPRPSSDIPRALLLARAGLPSLGTCRRMARCILIRKAYLERHPRHLQRALSPWISPGKWRQSPRISPLSIHVQHPNRSFFHCSPLFQAAATWNRFEFPFLCSFSNRVPFFLLVPSVFFSVSSIHLLSRVCL